MQKTQKTYTTEFKREAVRLAQTSGKPITHLAREAFVSRIPRSISGAKSWLNMAPKPSQAVDIRPPSKRRYAVSNASWKS